MGEHLVMIFKSSVVQLWCQIGEFLLTCRDITTNLSIFYSNNMFQKHYGNPASPVLYVVTTLFL